MTDQSERTKEQRIRRALRRKGFYLWKPRGSRSDYKYWVVEGNLCRDGDSSLDNLIERWTPVPEPWQLNAV